MNHPSRLFIIALIVWLLATAWPVFPFSLDLLLGLIGLFLLCCLAPILRLSRFVVLLVLTATIASGYQHWFVARITPQLEYESVQTLAFTVIDKPVRQDDRARYTARSPDGWQAYLTFNRSTIIEPGSQVIVQGKLLPINTQGNQFRQQSLVKDQLFGRLNYPKILKQEPAKLSLWEQSLIATRQLFTKTIHTLFVDPQAALFAGIVAGITSDLPTDIGDNFRIVGLSHIIAVSGFNITIIMQLFGKFAQRYGRTFYCASSLLVIVSFVYFTGGSASVLRAGILAALFTIGQIMQRKTSLVRLLVVTATLMTAVNPLILRYDIGFQLSFAAVFGLVIFATPIQNWLSRWHLPGWLSETIAATTAAQLTTWPIIAIYFHNFSLYSLVANTLVGPIIPILTALGIPLILLVAALPFLAVLSYPFDLLLRYSMSVAAWIAGWPMAQVETPTLPLFGWFSYGLLLVHMGLLAGQPKEEKPCDSS